MQAHGFCSKSQRRCERPFFFPGASEGVAVQGTFTLSPFFFSPRPLSLPLSFLKTKRSKLVSYCLNESGCENGVPFRTCVLKHVEDIRNPEDFHSDGAHTSDWASLTIDPLNGGCYGTGR